MASRNGVLDDPTLEQLVPEPQALFDAAGKMRKGHKSSFLRGLLDERPLQGSRLFWTPQLDGWVMEGAFLLNKIVPPMVQTNGAWCDMVAANSIMPEFAGRFYNTISDQYRA